ncbi:chemotaxis protein CheC [Bacillus spongiae]|uniref:Chemotaxis protein CheC n=1 Tax=Bacillus spongiae TaxID=2683610 RepID=A0ABU8HAE7_9BACI
MGFVEKITPLHLDLLREVGNIGAGHAATALSTLLNKKVDMKVPDVQIVSFDEMIEMAGGADSVAVSVFLRIEGDTPGSMYFMLPVDEASHYIRTMTGDSTFQFDSPPYSELGISAMQELGNILIGSYLSSLSDFTKLTLFPTVPSLNVDMVGALISFGLIEASKESDVAIVIDTALKEEHSQDGKIVKGHFFLLPDPDSFSTIFNALGVS